MFALTDSWGNPISEKYAQTRMRNEPLVEMSQIKGTSETHPNNIREKHENPGNSEKKHDFSHIRWKFGKQTQERSKSRGIRQ